jgi:hypothetical protein
VSGKVVACQTDGVCPEHGPFVWFCNECHKKWQASHPKTRAAISMMADPKVSYSKARAAYDTAKKEEQ